MPHRQNGDRLIGVDLAVVRWFTLVGAVRRAGVAQLAKRRGVAARLGIVDRTVLRPLKATGTACRPTRRPGRARRIPTATRSLRINQTVTDAIAAGQPVISVDTKKRELVGDFKAVGRELQPKGQLVEVRGHDFKDKQLGHAIPYGVYDLAADEGWVSVGITKDTASFAVNSILSRGEHLGKARYPDATSLTITADCGGSNSSRTRLWKVELQRLGRPDRPSDRRLPFPARDIEVEHTTAIHHGIRN